LKKLIFLVIAAILNEGGAVGHNFERDPPRDHPCQLWFNLVQRIQRRRFKCESLRRTAKAHMALGQASSKSANQRQELPVVAMFVNGSGRNEQSL
jgi:hypothetical protein